MLITKFDLFRTEWLDLVFSNRNKSYGAYELRQTYVSTLLKSMGITFLGVGAVIAAFIVFAKPAVQAAAPITACLEDFTRIIDVNLIKPEPPKKAPSNPAKAAAAAPAAEKVKTVAIPKTVSDDPAKTVEPVKNAEIKEAIGPVTNTDGITANNGPATNTNTQGGTGIDNNGGNVSNEPVNANIIEVLPEPVGGKDAWAKFLQKHLKYPAAAQDAGVSGRVFLSFIIERDGRLTDIKVDRGAGYGFDEEALRVLKLAPAWKPGIQNGRAVRVKYTIPINFRLPE